MSMGLFFDTLLTAYLSRGIILLTAILLVFSAFVFFSRKTPKKRRIFCGVVVIYCIFYFIVIFALSFLFSSNHGPAQPTLVSADSVVYAEVREMNKENAREVTLYPDDDPAHKELVLALANALNSMSPYENEEDYDKNAVMYDVLFKFENGLSCIADIEENLTYVKTGGLFETTEELIVACQTALAVEESSAVLGVSDLQGVLNALDLREASLTYYGEADETHPANSAIRAESYIEQLKNFTWAEGAPPAEWDGDDHSRYVLEVSGTTLIAYHSTQADERLLHAVTEHGEGWFVLPGIQTELGTTEQADWMIYDIFTQWFDETKTAVLYGGNGTPLTEEEFIWFEEYTASTWMNYDAYGEYPGGPTEISCFFTSQYDAVTELNFEEFMRYFPGADNANPVSDMEFEALKKVENWPFKEVESRDSMPVPIHKYPRSTVDAVLKKYAGITTKNLDTSGVAYLETYDAYYNYTSDFGPGMFSPCYGEKNGDVVVLWTAPAGYDGSSRMLTLQKTGSNWYISSHIVVTGKLSLTSPDVILDVVSYMKSVSASDFKEPKEYGNVSGKELADALNGAVKNLMNDADVPVPFTNQWAIRWVFLEGNPTGVTNKDLHLSISCGLRENVVKVSACKGQQENSAYFEDATLCQLVRHSGDYEETIDMDAYAHVENELEAKMVSTVEQMSENPLGATGYELTQFENILDFVANEHDSLKLYRYRYAITVEHPERDGWSGGMYLDSKLRAQDAYRWAGYVAILESRGSVVETLWYDSDYSFDDGSLEIDSSDYDAQLRRWAEKTINETPMGD